MTRAVVNVASDSWVRGQNRLHKRLHEMGENLVLWTNQLPPGSPPHRLHGAFAGTQEKNIPYAFKAYALVEAAKQYDTLLWADACILPVQPLESLWERIERDGYWISRQGYNNYEWTADSACKDLFPECGNFDGDYDYTHAREINRTIPHVVATSFGFSVKHPQGRAFLSEYYRLASTTRAFCGPWSNANVSGAVAGFRTAPCGPPDVWGHRHDQTAASVIAWRLGFELTSPPEVFAYRGGEDERTILVADGAY